jgi:hypothetical protein
VSEEARDREWRSIEKKRDNPCTITTSPRTLAIGTVFFVIFSLIPNYGTLCSVSNGTRYLLPATYCIFCDFFGVKSNTNLH